MFEFCGMNDVSLVSKLQIATTQKVGLFIFYIICMYLIYNIYSNTTNATMLLSPIVICDVINQYIYYTQNILFISVIL